MACTSLVTNWKLGEHFLEFTVTSVFLPFPLSITLLSLPVPKIRVYVVEMWLFPSLLLLGVTY